MLEGRRRKLQSENPHTIFLPGHPILEIVHWILSGQYIMANSAKDYGRHRGLQNHRDTRRATSIAFVRSVEAIIHSSHQGANIHSVLHRTKASFQKFNSWECFSHSLVCHFPKRHKNQGHGCHDFSKFSKTLGIPLHRLRQLESFAILKCIEQLRFSLLGYSNPS